MKLCDKADIEIGSARSTHYEAASWKVDTMRNPRHARGPHLAGVTTGPLHPFTEVGMSAESVILAVVLLAAALWSLRHE